MMGASTLNDKNIRHAVVRRTAHFSMLCWRRNRERRYEPSDLIVLHPLDESVRRVPLQVPSWALEDTVVQCRLTIVV